MFTQGLHLYPSIEAGIKVSKEVRDRVSMAWRLRFQGHTQEEIADIMHMGKRQVQNYLSPTWLAKRGLEYLSQPEQHQPPGGMSIGTGDPIISSLPRVG